LKNSKTKIDKILSTSKTLNNYGLDGNTVLGNPIFVGDDVIIPVSKITTFALGGGGEYGEVKLFSKKDSHQFAGGSGALVNVSPAGFLIRSNNKYDFVKSAPDIYDKIAEKAFVDNMENEELWAWMLENKIKDVALDTIRKIKWKIRCKLCPELIDHSKRRNKRVDTNDHKNAKDCQQ
jgi:uncharacterized spore protein YtfJ